jgi:hypothetical protein
VCAGQRVNQEGYPSRSSPRRCKCRSRERLLDPIHRRVTSVLDLDPVRRAAGAVPALAALGNHALQPELAGVAEQVWSDLALLEVADEDAIRPPDQ